MNNRKRLLITGAVILLVGWLIYNFLFPTTTYLKYGLVNRDGKFVIPPRFDELHESNNGWYTGDNYAFDDDWRLWYSCGYDPNLILRECAPVKLDPPKAQLDTGLPDVPEGKQTPEDKLLIRSYKKDFLAHTLLGFKNTQVEWVIQPRYWDYVTNFSHGRAFVWLEGYPYGKWGIINPKGEYVLKPTCAHIWPFHNGRALCQVAFTETRFLLSNPEVDEDLKYYPR